MGSDEVDSKQQNLVESYGGSPMPLEGTRGLRTFVRKSSNIDNFIKLLLLIAY